MGLTEAEFSQVRSAMRVPGAPTGEDPTGKRRSARLTVDAIVAFAPCREPGTPTAEAAAHWVNVIDLSRTGVSILFKSQLAPGERFVLALPSDGEQHLPAVCTVQHSRVKIDGTFRVGAEFCEPVAAGADKVEAALAALRGIGVYVSDVGRSVAAGANAAGPTPQSRPAGQPQRSQRRSERRSAEGRAVIHTYGEDGEPGAVEEVPALDFSETGVCIFRRDPLKVGDHFMARIPLLDAGPIISLCRVTNVTPCDGENRYRIGAEFIPVPGVATRMARRIMKWFGQAA